MKFQFTGCWRCADANVVPPWTTPSYVKLLWFLAEPPCLVYSSKGLPMNSPQHGCLNKNFAMTPTDMLIWKGKPPEALTLGKELQRDEKKYERNGLPQGRALPVGYPIPNGWP